MEELKVTFATFAGCIVLALYFVNQSEGRKKFSASTTSCSSSEKLYQ